ncbi:hypothetical protein [Xanthomonas sp. XNM01]|uniref:hypothetical protein n=1 Tax=Xanthomonas sp. XNM01 TaxID=2769289 RepID=UPI00177F0428|nr:hypothetical protein [Xanthomonas sp. XNM01]MBD9368270.1 hypothetical protein [Xanthomonas sp. XNM01]
MKASPKTFLLVAGVLLATTLALPASAQDMIPAEQAARHVGKNGMVCGKVEKTRYAQNSEGEPTFLYMGGAFPRHTFSARIPGDQRDKFRPSPEELEGRDVCVIGTIERDASRAEIAVSSPANIKLATIK